MPPSGSPRKTDRWLLLEIGMVLAFLVLAIFLYWRPAAGRVWTPQWWHGLALVGLFFAIVGLHMRRRRRDSHRALKKVLSDSREDAAAARQPVAPELKRESVTLDASVDATSDLSPQRSPEANP
jgi:hypothetical protein